MNNGEVSDLSTALIGETELKIASARQFPMHRLGDLEQKLPSKPIRD
jgi:hypothetical protein